MQPFVTADGVKDTYWRFDTLWQHQTDAIRRLSTNPNTQDTVPNPKSQIPNPKSANTIVATGTGSGKTETFLIPIVDDCLRHLPSPASGGRAGDGGGVRAIIIYPMNALANDQLERLRKLLGGTGVTFGRYTGDTPFNTNDAQERGIPRPSNSPDEERYTREEIQKNPPHILITNYVMLELLLLRKDDQKIFHGVKPRYLVLDEVHTYTGILGAEVACLIRRLKEHAGLSPGELACVGTSATIIGDDQADGRSRLIEFATELFAEPFSDNAVVEEAYEAIAWPDAEMEPAPDLDDADLAGVNPEDPDDVRRLARIVLGLDIEAKGDLVFEALHEAIAGRRAFTELEELLQSPKPLSAVVEAFGRLNGRQGRDPQQLQREVMALLLLGSAARKPGTEDPPETRFRPKIHLIIRSLAPLSVCLHPDCGQLLTDGATGCRCNVQRSNVQRATTRALILGLCRSCGADYRIGYFAVTDDMLRTSRGTKRARKDLEIQHVGAVPLHAGESQADQLEPMYLYPGTPDDLVPEGEDDPPVTTAGYVVCPFCLHGRLVPAGDPSASSGQGAVCDNATCSYHEPGPLPRFAAFLRGSRCPVCQAQGRGPRPEIITPLRSGAAPSVSVLAQSLFPYLEAGNGDRPSEKRILIFADSRQDTAHQAGFLRDRHQVFTRRQIVYQTLRRHEGEGRGPIPLPNLAEEAFLRTRDARGEVEAMNLLTPIEYRDATVAGFFEEGQVISRRQIQDAIAQLRWDLAVEFTDRATSRYSLEREGLTTVRYARMGEIAEAALPDFGPYGITNADSLEGLMRSLLQARGYIHREDIGKLSGYGKLSTKAYQIAEQYIEVTTEGERYRCPTCGQSRGYLLQAMGTGEPVCGSYRCQGKPALHVPDPETNFYVRVYGTGEPERLYPVEHSGQLGNDERVAIENKFKAGQVNTLVCTPTLELGVDIGDLVALIMRNVPPTPSNYAQRAGRAGRNRRLALILSHAGLSPHDSYFFQHPEDMITGQIRPPLFLLDNRVVIDRHLNSLILEKLDAELPVRWEGIRTDEGYLREEVLQPFEEELATRGPDIQVAVAGAFVRERDEGGLPWLTEDYVQDRMEQFMDGLRAGLEHWCRRYREVYEELRKSRMKIRPSKADQEREGKLNTALFILENDRRYYPLSYLAQVGFLPRYGFPGSTVAIRDDRQREITQAASVGIREYAPGNVVYVGGRKLRVIRLLFGGSARDDPQYNAETYKRCPNCDYATGQHLARECPYCHESLISGRFIDYEAGFGGEIDFITQEDEYRRYENYDDITYLRDRQGEPTPHHKTLVYGPWAFEYSRLREVEIFNRGRLERGSGCPQPFLVCLECGMWHERQSGESNGQVKGHLHSCTVNTWDPEEDECIADELHLRAHMQGDVVEIPLPAEVVHNSAWIETFAQSLKLAMQLQYFVGPHELDSFVRRWQEDGQARASLVLYDTMPGGTGYLLRLVDNIPQLAGRVAQHLRDCPCERACYRCLKEFWNQRLHEMLDKTLVLNTLKTLAEAGAGTALPPLSAQREFESFLEAKFYDLLQHNGLPLPKAQQIVRTPDGTYIMRADFTYDRPPVVVLTDGRAYHAEDPMTVIEDRGLRIENGGWRIEMEEPPSILNPQSSILTSAGLSLTPRLIPLPPGNAA